MRKQYIIPQTEVLTLSGTSVMLGASGDIHTGNTGGIQTGSQGGAHAPKWWFGAPVF